MERVRKSHYERNGNSGTTANNLASRCFRAAGLRPGDQVDWRFEDGEIRGRKLLPTSQPRVIVGRLVRKDGALVCDTDGLSIDPDDIARVVREEREDR
jgi:hypothetical protein